MVIFGYRIRPLLAKVYREVGADHVSGLAAEGAYYFFFSLFPIFLFLAPLLSLVGERGEMFNTVIGYLEGALPPEGFILIRNVLRDVVFTENAPSLMSVGAVLAVWSGSNVFGALMNALNQAYDITDSRPWWKRRLVAIAAVILVGLTILVATVVLLAGEDITRWLARVAGLGAAEQSMLLAVQFVVAVTLLILVAALSYRFLPDCRQSFRHCFAAGVLTTALWILVTLAFRTYVQNFGNYNKTYGTIGGVIVLLTWMYFSMLVFLVGGEVASELHRGTGSVEPRHGALVGDRIETAVATDLASTDRIERLEPLRPRSV